jgi:hypothetical protein
MASAKLDDAIESAIASHRLSFVISEYLHQSVPIGERAQRRRPVVATGLVGTASNWHFVSSATDVAGQVGTHFGIEFRIDGNPVAEGVTLHMVLKFPRRESAIRRLAIRCIPSI